MTSDSIKIIGTSHIAKESILEVKKAIEEFKPDIIAIELDLPRLNSLLSKKRKRSFSQELKNFGLTGVIFLSFGAWLERKLGEKVGISPGSEMLTAIKAAKDKKIDIALIDQDIRITVKKLTKQVKFKEKWRIFLDLLRVPFMKTPKGEIEVDLEKVPKEEVIEKLLKQVKKRYPGMYKTLIEDRNKVLAKNLYKLKEDNKNKKILAVIGAGHKKEVIKLLNGS